MTTVFTSLIALNFAAYASASADCSAGSMSPRAQSDALHPPVPPMPLRGVSIITKNFASAMDLRRRSTSAHTSAMESPRRSFQGLRSMLTAAWFSPIFVAAEFPAAV